MIDTDCDRNDKHNNIFINGCGIVRNNNGCTTYEPYDDGPVRVNYNTVIVIVRMMMTIIIISISIS